MGDDEEYYDEDEEDEEDEEEETEKSLDEIFDEIDELKEQFDYASSLLDWQDKIRGLSNVYKRVEDYPLSAKEKINKEFYYEIKNLLNRLEFSKNIYKNTKLDEGYRNLSNRVDEEIGMIDRLKENLENKLDSLDYDANEKCENCKKERVGYNPVKTTEFRNNYRRRELIFCSHDCSDKYFYVEDDPGSD